jgi:hypothetical protein
MLHIRGVYTAARKVHANKQTLRNIRFECLDMSASSRSLTQAKKVSGLRQRATYELIELTREMHTESANQARNATPVGKKRELIKKETEPVKFRDITRMGTAIRVIDKSLAFLVVIKKLIANQ